MEVVAGCLDSIWEDPASLPGLIFYGKGCALRRYRLRNPKTPGWELITSLTGNMVLSQFRQALRCRVFVVVCWPPFLATQELGMGWTCSTFRA